MPLIEVNVINGVFTPEQKSSIVIRLTDATVEVEDENLRPVTWCVLRDVGSGDWGKRRKSAEQGRRTHPGHRRPRRDLTARRRWSRARPGGRLDHEHEHLD